MVNIRYHQDFRLGLGLYGYFNADQRYCFRAICICVYFKSMDKEMGTWVDRVKFDLDDHRSNGIFDYVALIVAIIALVSGLMLIKDTSKN